MPIKINNAPAESFDILKSKAQSHHHELITHDTNGNQNHYIPHKVYDLNIFNLAEGGELSNTQQSAWRYIIQDENGHNHVVEIGINEVLDEHNLHFINTGNHVNNFLKIYENISEHEYVKYKDYEINLVRSNQIYLLAIWLRGVNHDHEFFIPIPPVNNRFEANKTYSYGKFSNLLKKISREYVKNNMRR
ncbi:hypothetical protein [Chryseobacterium sp. FH1]|uniref:hypothetical protein n=1 Tax=Chryseobacterium sp. FH1 TaxID=1233951 RepID=UPI0004E3DF17|nr:hypothetical protein [Chryseobacterium sp. FH1]KFC19682.1 hypothetical protein IO90_10440 [Chryseobacterium sp. FH1]